LYALPQRFTARRRGKRYTFPDTERRLKEEGRRERERVRVGRAAHPLAPAERAFGDQVPEEPQQRSDHATFRKIGFLIYTHKPCSLLPIDPAEVQNQNFLH